MLIDGSAFDESGAGMTKAANGMYVPPYDVVRSRLGFESRDPATVEVTLEQAEGVLRLLLRSMPVDEQWYRRTYPDVAEAIDAGMFRSAHDHFVQNGYFEGRHPCEVEVDEDWYVATYEDVAEGIETGEISSAADHFRRHGYKEGRLPYEP